MSSTCYDSFEDNVMRGNINVANDAFYAILTNGYTPNKGAHQYRSDITGEVSGTGYAAGGIPIAITPTKDPVNHAEVLTAAAVSWPSSNISATGMAIYKHRGGLASADELVGFIDFGGTVTSTGGTFSVAASSITLNTPTGA